MARQHTPRFAILPLDPSVPQQLVAESAAMFSHSSSRVSFARDQLPVTYTVVAVAVVLQLAVWIYPEVRPSEKRETRRHLGAVTQLGIYRKTEVDKPAKMIPQLLGPFDLWEGELWRIPVSGFHHVNLWHPYNPLHLIFNCLAIAFMGGILEPRLGRWTYAAFFLSAIIVSLVPELLMEPEVMGLSGGAYALFGCLLVLKQHEDAIADRLPPNFVSTGFVWLFLCMALTYLDMIAIGNAAHVAGLFYGWLFGQAFCAPHKRGDQFRSAFVVSHVLLLPAAYFLMHPFWLGTYHWYRANNELNEPRKIGHLEKAIASDPSLRRPWVLLAKLYVRQGDVHRAWETVIRGLDYNRSDDEGVQYAQKLWRAFHSSEDRWQALQTLAARFGDQNREWQARLGILPDGTEPAGFPLAFEFGFPDRNLYQPRSEAERDVRRLFTTTDIENHELTAPQVEPTRPDSAAEGITL